MFLSLYSSLISNNIILLSYIGPGLLTLDWSEVKELTLQNDSYIKTIKKVMKELTPLIPKPVEEMNPLWEAGG